MPLRLHLVQCKSNFECKMNVGKVNTCKENEIRVFGFAMENSSENDFRCLVTF